MPTDTFDAGRYTVRRAGTGAAVPAGALVVDIEADVAFGDGSHPTTKGSLQALDHIATSGAKVFAALDVGTGTGVLAIATRLTWPTAATLATELDPRALPIARANVEANDVVGAVQVLGADGFNNPIVKSSGPYDLIFINILTNSVIAMAADCERLLEPGGHAVLSGIRDNEAPSVVEAYEIVGCRFVAFFDVGRWRTVLVKKG